MTDSSPLRLTIDEIEPDDDGTPIATLVNDDGLIARVPLALLPSGARLNQVIVARFEVDESSTKERKRRVRDLQHRLFNRESDR